MKQFIKFITASCLGTGLALLLGTFILMSVFGSIAASQDEKITVKKNSVLTLALDKQIIWILVLLILKITIS